MCDEFDLPSVSQAGDHDDHSQGRVRRPRPAYRARAQQPGPPPKPLRPRQPGPHTLGRVFIAVSCLLAAPALTACGNSTPTAAEELSRGHAAVKAGNGPAAIEHFKRGLAQQPDVAGFVALAQLYITQGKLEDAHVLLGRATERFGEDAALRALYGEVLASQGQLRPAEKAYRQAYELKPEQPDLLLRWAALVQDTASAMTATKRLRAVVEKTGSPEAVIILAELRRQSGAEGSAHSSTVQPDRPRLPGTPGGSNASQAPSPTPELAQALARLYLLRRQPPPDTTERLLRIAAADPKASSAIRLLHGNLAADLGRFREAEQTLAVERQATPADGNSNQASSAQWRLLRARIALSNGDAKQAKEILVEILPQVPPEGRGLANSCLGQAHLALGDTAAAVPVLQQVQPKSPGYRQAQVALAKHELSTDQTSDAVQRLTQLLQQFPRYETPYGLLAAARLKSEDRAGAKQLLLRGVHNAPQSGLLWYELGRLTLMDEDLAQATGRLEQAVHLAPTLLPARPLLAQALIRTGRTPQAMEVYEQGLQRVPDALAWQNNLAVLYADERTKLDRALALATSAYQIGNRSPALADTLGWVHHRRGDFQLAHPLLDRAAREMPKDAEVLLHQALNLRALGKTREARRVLTSAQKLAKDNPQVERKFKQLLTDTP